MVPPPVFATASVLAAGSAPPCVALNERLDGVTDSAGGVGALTVNVTGIVAGEPPAPLAVTVTSVVYVPGARPEVSGVTAIVPAPVPLAGATLSQLAFSDAVQFSEPPPVFVTLSVLAAGLEPPCVPLNDRLEGLTANIGGDGAAFLNATVAIVQG